MSKNIKSFFLFYLLWSIAVTAGQSNFWGFYSRFDFVIIILSILFLAAELNYFKLHRNVPETYVFIFCVFVIWIFVNIFRNPPDNFNGFIRYLFGRYYVAAWFPVFFFFLGTQIRYWKQIRKTGLKLIKFFVLFSPVIIYLFVYMEGFYWSRLVDLTFFIPLFLVNWSLLSKREKRYIIFAYIIAIFFTFTGGSRGWTIRLLIYLPVASFFYLVLNKQNKQWNLIKIITIVSSVAYIVYYVYYIGVSDMFSDSFKEHVGKFEKGGFINSREAYVYPDFFADMKSGNDWVFGRGLNGSYYSEIFENVMADLNESNSLGVVKGYRTELECGYLQTILKIGLIGLALELILALSAVYLGLFRSKNWFAKGCAFIVLEWLFAMYPGGLPEWSVPFILFWLCIGACLSREIRMAPSSSLIF